jgi:ABC-type polar amino acid transport system ATPase subunit
MVTHEREIAERFADRIITMADGRIVKEETR